MNITMNIKKYMMLGGVALALGIANSSCVGDLDLEPIDPTKIFADPSNEEWLGNAFSQCYANLIHAGNSDPGGANISTPNAGMSVYNRIVFGLCEYPTDEAFWIWEDDGHREIITNSFSANNVQLEVCYSRLYQHIAVCNSFMAVTEDNADNEKIARMRAEVRTLRALSYYFMVDLFGNVGFILSAPDGTEPVQTPRAEIYKWLEGELAELVDGGELDAPAVYGRIGKDAAEALLARVYLNAEVYTDGAVSAWDKCLQRCNNIIERHKGTGYKQSGLANNYLALFCGNNEEYMPGGGNTAENEILWGLPFDGDHAQSYGGTTFLMAGAISAGGFGCQSAWSSLTAREELSRRFESEPQDTRWSLWIRDGRGIENAEFGKFENAGYQAIKWTNLMHTNGVVDMSSTFSSPWGVADLALFRLADVYLMRAECFLHGQGDRVSALEGVNYLRERAGVSKWVGSDLNAENLLDERSRELYFEMTRRTDLIRFGKYVGPAQATWAWKGNSLDGGTISERYRLMPIPTNILAAQPEFKQNPGY